VVTDEAFEGGSLAGGDGSFVVGSGPHAPRVRGVARSAVQARRAGHPGMETDTAIWRISGLSDRIGPFPYMALGAVRGSLPCGRFLRPADAPARGPQ
jgi:hypothetical protein